MSGVCDETNWIEDANIDSSAKFLEVGYKDGGSLVGMVNVPGGMILLKNNRRVYRLNIGYPAWSLAEISCNTEISGRLSACAAADSVFVLGQNEVQNIQAANVYGNLKPQNLALPVASEIKKVAGNSLLRYLPKLNQIWILNGEEIFIVKPDRLSKLDEKIFQDSGFGVELSRGEIFSSTFFSGGG